MRSKPNSPWFRAFTGAAILLCVGSLRAQGQSVPSADEVVRKMFERSRSAEAKAQRDQYGYSRRSVVEELGDKGQVRERKEKLYQVVPIAGVPYPRLMKVNGEELADRQRKQEAEKEKQFRDRVAKNQKVKLEEHRELKLHDDLLGKFTFTMLGREKLDGRSAFVIGFAPKSPGASGGKIEDRILGNVEGKVWVDEAEFELARLDLHLTGKVSIGWGGIVASVQTFKFALTRTRVGEAAWFPTEFQAEVEGRRLISSMRFKIRELTSDYKLVTAEKAQPARN